MGSGATRIGSCPKIAWFGLTGLLTMVLPLEVRVVTEDAK